MSIRRKLTFLLLFMTLVPLAISRIAYNWISQDANKLRTDEMRQVLVDKAKNNLLTVTEDFSRLLDAKENNIKLIVRFQAEKIERLLADAMLVEESQPEKNRQVDESTPSDLSDVFTTIKNFGFDGGIPEDEIKNQARLSHFRVGPSDEKTQNLGVSYKKQRCYTIGENRGQRFQLNQLGSMTRDYFELNKMSRGAVLRQYTILDSGVFISYPFGTARSDEEVGDLRKTKLYRQVHESQKGGIVISPPAIDQITGLTVMVVAVPLLYPDGSFAGMTGLDLITKNLFDELNLPEEDWQGETTAMLVKRLGPYSEAPGKIAVLEKQTGSRMDGRPDDIKESRPEDDQMAGRQIRLRYLEASDPELLNKIVDQAEAGKSGIERMPFDGQEAIWAFGPARTGEEANEPFLIVIVPEKMVVAQADQSEDYIRAIAFNERLITGGIFLVVAIIAGIIGFRSAKVVTRPIGRIAEAGIRLSEGDYHAHVEIHTKDELQRLAEVFNETGPKLLEREKMMHSLAMASEIQQQLLPQEPPVCEGFDVAGKSLYCDETGGDYFDYLMLHGESDDAPRLGVAIGDVSGHGIGAALIMASVRSVLRSHADEYQDRLDALMSLLNRSMTDEAETGRFVTFCFSLFDPKQRTLKWVSAGHDPALYLHRDSDTDALKIDELPNSGLPLGVVDDADYEAMGPLNLNSGDIVLLGTDGVWETADTSGHPFGKERLRQILREMHGQPADAIREAIVKAVTTFRGDGPQLDDVTLVVVKVS